MVYIQSVDGKKMVKNGAPAPIQKSLLRFAPTGFDNPVVASGFGDPLGSFSHW